MFSLTFSSRYLLIFLKFVQAVIPTIEYDYTRHFTMWAFTINIKRFSFESPMHTLDFYYKALWLVGKNTWLSQPIRKQKTFVIVERFIPAVVTFEPRSQLPLLLGPQSKRERGGDEVGHFWVLTNWLWLVESFAWATCLVLRTSNGNRANVIFIFWD